LTSHRSDNSRDRGNTKNPPSDLTPRHRPRSLSTIPRRLTLLKRSQPLIDLLQVPEDPLNLSVTHVS